MGSDTILLLSKHPRRAIIRLFWLPIRAAARWITHPGHGVARCRLAQPGEVRGCGGAAGAAERAALCPAFSAAARGESLLVTLQIRLFGLLHLGCFAGQIPRLGPALAPAEEAPGRPLRRWWRCTSAAAARRGPAVAPWGAWGEELPLAAPCPAAGPPHPFPGARSSVACSPGSRLAGSGLHGAVGLPRGQPVAPVHGAGPRPGWLATMGRPAGLHTQELWWPLRGDVPGKQRGCAALFA